LPNAPLELGEFFRRKLRYNVLGFMKCAHTLEYT
jgi:hypothetical protein